MKPQCLKKWGEKLSLVFSFLQGQELSLGVSWNQQKLFPHTNTPKEAWNFRVYTNPWEQGPRVWLRADPIFHRQMRLNHGLGFHVLLVPPCLLKENKPMSPLDEVIEKNQINPGHLYQHYEKASPLRKMPDSGNHLFGSYNEAVKMCQTGCRSWNKEPCLSMAGAWVSRWAGAPTGGWTNQPPGACSGTAEHLSPPAALSEFQWSWSRTQLTSYTSHVYSPKRSLQCQMWMLEPQLMEACCRLTQGGTKY